MWNNRFLREPPAASEKYAVEEVDKVAMREARGKIFDLLEIYQKDESLKSESIILGRLYYKFCNQWRREKIKGNMKQIEKCVKRFLEMHLEKNLNHLLERIPGRLSKQDKEIYLPTRQVVEFVLVRLLGASSLMDKAAILCTCAYNNVSRQMSEGLFVSSMMIVTASICRIWVLCRSLTIELSKCYMAVFDWLKSLSSSGQSLMTEDEILPEDIFVWRQMMMNAQINGLDSSLILLLPVERGISLTQADPNGTKLPSADGAGHTIISHTIHQPQYEELGQPVDRKTFSLLCAENIGDGKLKKLQGDGCKKGKKKTNIMKRVAAILQIPETEDCPGPLSAKDFKVLTESEHSELHRKVKASDCVRQLQLLLKKINQTFPGEKFKGLKKCRTEVKRLRKTSRNIGKDRMVRRKENNKILKEGKKIVKRFLKKNSAITKKTRTV